MYILSNSSIISFFTIFLGHTFASSFLQYYFYYYNGKYAHSWKIQNKGIKNLSAKSRNWWFPILFQKKDRAINHEMFATINLVIASLFAAIVSECSVYELNNMSFKSIHSYGSLKVVYDIMIAIVFQSIAEYYWHRMMHLPFFYKYFHKYHHFYKSPEPWDDMYIHPVEAIGYYLILYLPPFLFTCHIYAFLIYMIIMGI